MKVSSITVDKVNANGRLYPRAVVEKAIAEYTEKFVKQGRAFGEIGNVIDSTVNLARASHQIMGFEWVGDTLLVDVRIMTTPLGKTLSHLVDAGMTIAMTPRGLGSLKDGVVQEDYTLNAFDAIEASVLA